MIAPLGECFCLENRLHWRRIRGCGTNTAFRESVHHAAHYLQVPIPVLGCTGRFVGTNARQPCRYNQHQTSISLVQMLHRYRKPLPYLWARRLETWFTRHEVGTLQLSGSLQTAQTDLQPAAARSDILGAHRNQCDARMQPTRSNSHNKLCCGRVAQTSL